MKLLTDREEWEIARARGSVAEGDDLSPHRTAELLSIIEGLRKRLAGALGVKLVKSRVRQHEVDLEYEEPFE